MALNITIDIINRRSRAVCRLTSGSSEPNKLCDEQISLSFFFYFLVKIFIFFSYRDKTNFEAHFVASQKMRGCVFVLFFLFLQFKSLKKDYSWYGFCIRRAYQTVNLCVIGNKNNVCVCHVGCIAVETTYLLSILKIVRIADKRSRE